MTELAIKLEFKGEPTVRLELASGLYGTPGSIQFQEVEAWLKLKEFERQQQVVEEKRQREKRVERREELRDEDARTAARDAKVLAWFSIAIALSGLLIALSRG